MVAFLALDERPIQVTCVIVTRARVKKLNAVHLSWHARAAKSIDTMQFILQHVMQFLTRSNVI